jgi:hypothetical protein
VFVPPQGLYVLPDVSVAFVSLYVIQSMVTRIHWGQEALNLLYIEIMPILEVYAMPVNKHPINEG